jgi:hypothetical protein
LHPQSYPQDLFGGHFLSHEGRTIRGGAESP